MKSRYHSPTAKNGSGLATQSMSSHTSWSADTVAAGATGTASTIRDAPCARATLAGGACSRAGGDPVVHNDGAAALEVEPGAAFSIARGAPIELTALPLLDRLELDRADGARPDGFLVLHPYPVLSDGPHRQLGLERNTQLSHDDDVEGCAQNQTHFSSDRHAATGQPEDDGPVASETGTPHDPSQVATGVHTIAEHRHHLLDASSLPASPGHHQIRAGRALCLQRQVPGWSPWRA